MKRETNRLAATLFGVCGLAVTSYGQVNNPEAEPNETKATATVAASGGAGMAPGDYITGNTTGGTSTAGPASWDYFRVKTAAAPLGIYRYRLVITSTIAGHTGNIRGLNQTGATQAAWAGVSGTPGTTDSTIQTSSASTTPARFNQWYGFGKQEELYYSVTGAAATTADYTSTLERVAVTPTVVSGTFIPGPIIIKTLGEGHTTDTDFWVYDSNFNPIPGFGNDDEAATAISNVPGATGTSLQGVLNRTFLPGTYYLAMSSWNSCSNLASPSDDDFRTGLLLDFPNAYVNNSTTTGTNLQFSISDGTTTTAVPNTHAGAFDVNWFAFTVAGTTGACCLGAPSYSCIVTSQTACTTAGGNYAGDNVTCAAANCPPPPTGACCLTDGNCNILTAAQCTTAGGSYAGDNVTCAAANCPVGGACCTDTGCVTLTSAACTTAGGTWQAGSCGTVTCPVTVYNESGDAGDLRATAQVPAGSGSLLKIKGTFTASDVDMYQINICDAANWSATTVGGSTIDTQLWLFKQDGTGVACDDDSAGGLQSTLTSLRVAPLGNGTYFLAISVFNRDAAGASTNGLIWTSNVQDTAPDGPAAAEPIGGWLNTTTATGPYTIVLTGTCWNTSCYANCDGSTSTPVLTANDFQCFLNEYAAGTNYANCDGSTSVPVLTANDFQCFLNAYAAGCT